FVLLGGKRGAHRVEPGERQGDACALKKRPPRQNVSAAGRSAASCHRNHLLRIESTAVDVLPMVTRTLSEGYSEGGHGRGKAKGATARRGSACRRHASASQFARVGRASAAGKRRQH